MKKIILLIAIIIGLISCEKAEEKPSKAYYNFDETDRLNIPDYTLGQVLIYKNQDGEEIKFKVSKLDFQEKKIYGVGMGFFGEYAAEYFFYDKMDIEFMDDSGYTFACRYSEWPINEKLAKEDLYTKLESKMIIDIYQFPYWNEIESSGYPNSVIWVDLSKLKSTLNINGKTYNNVFKINSKDNLPYSQKRNVNVIYYLEGNGIIGFDDLNNKAWRLQ